MDMNSLLVVLLFLFIGVYSNEAANNDTDVSDRSSSWSEGIDTLVGVPYQVYSEPRSNKNYSFNTSFFEFTTMTTTKSRKRVRKRRGPPRNAFLDNLDETVMPIALCLGIVGNLILFPIFVYSPLKANPLSHYLAAMGVADLLYLLSCLIVWTKSQDLTIYDTIGVCQLTNFFLRISRFLATWYLFAAHVERFLVHFGSFRGSAWCSTFRARFIIIFVFIFSLVGFLHYIWTHVLLERGGQIQCMIMPESIKHIIQLGKIEMIAALFLPMVLIITIDIALCINTIVKRYKLYFRVPSKNGSVKSSEQGQDELGDYVLALRHRNGSHSKRSAESSPPPEYDLSLERRAATIVVIICGLVFIGLLLPSSVYTAKIYFIPNTRLKLKDMNTMRLFEQLVKVNSVYKFFLYWIFLRPFRKGLVYIFTCRHRRKPDECALQETTEV